MEIGKTRELIWRESYGKVPHKNNIINNSINEYKVIWRKGRNLKIICTK